jgi:DNA invertase Pin-like site-specific DNA recombinase
MERRMPPPFQTRHEIDRYLGGEVIQCLLCGRRFQKLAPHLSVVHDLTSDGYRTQFGLPWHRGLVSAIALAASRWTRKRKAKARRRLLRRPIFKFARSARRRELAPFLKAENLQRLGIDASATGKKFEERVRKLFKKKLSNRAIARKLNVGVTTVQRRTQRWRRPGVR